MGVSIPSVATIKAARDCLVAKKHRDMERLTFINYLVAAVLFCERMRFLKKSSVRRKRFGRGLLIHRFECFRWRLRF